MKDPRSPLSPAARLGTWSAWALTVLGIVLIAANVGILATGQWPAWQDARTYADWLAGLQANFWTMAFVAAFLMTIALTGIMAALQALAPRERKVFGAMALAFTSVCVALEGIVYVVQLGPIRHGALGGRLEGFEPFIYHSPGSVVFAVDILGYFFLGLATVSAAGTVAKKGLDRVLFWLFVAFGAENVLGLGCFLADYAMGLAIYNILMTLTLVAAGPLLALHFGACKTGNPDSPPQ